MALGLTLKPVTQGTVEVTVTQNIHKQDTKDPARTAAPANVDIALMKAGDTIASVVLLADDRVLLPNQTDPVARGLYKVGALAGEAARTEDANEDAEVTNSMAVHVVEGDEQGLWVLTTSDPIEVGTTALTFVKEPAPPAAAHAIGGAEHTADTLANLNTKVSDATLDDAGDARPPQAHTHTHASTTGQTATDHHDNINDPTAGQKAALVGTGTPSGGNPYVSSDDARMTDDRNPTAHTHVLADVTDSGTLAGLSTVGTSELGDEAVTNAKLAHMAQSTVKGRAAGAGTGDATDLSVAQVKTLLALVHSDLGSVGFDDHKTVNTVQTTDNVATTIATIPLADNTVVEIAVNVVGRRTDAGARIGGMVRATVYREAAGGVVVEGVSKDLDKSVAQYDVNIIGSGNDALVQVTGNTGHTVNWRTVLSSNLVA